ncbi:hypothetical protein [Mesorhizobium sp. M7A.F.Ca.MR.245.00.0.0]|uniref:hypothetical protein n=1 Tax=Mesorhizobium sp. M7A.F.Ca.MR.245.00.0.0 TaxID=2496778 RepID=UPI000FCBBEDE|nr:hypothetical protein [Mesorhizobium sp. M7A.F.Ca.MR.245.00.0.0]RUV19146.1 hypothetical protein EOB80_20260 [Mesorhizobium sp. M7A.F.Ca.MR.245.00.0.0]RUV51286.1 hypothetical protein EOB77_11505 [Mesorhizobium sp. M7A.F.Ca.MR.228.00.0.0]
MIYVVEEPKPDGWIFSFGEDGTPFIVWDEVAAKLVEEDNPSYLVRPFVLTGEPGGIRTHDAR